mmetsp:Transcript_5728/g.18246  ORF Transcript_5728/g.18246 Transcript_5728/m.18246 type:complete len:303 (+) Transcript_5728:714-1622(+)
MSLCGSAARCRWPTGAPSGWDTDRTSAPLWQVCNSTRPSPAPDAARSRSAESATAEIARTWPRRYRRGRGVTQCLGEGGADRRQSSTVVSSAPVRRRERERAIQVIVRECSRLACNVFPASELTHSVPSQCPPDSTTAPRPPSPPAKNRLKQVRAESEAGSWVRHCRRRLVVGGGRPEGGGGHLNEWTVDLASSPTSLLCSASPATHSAAMDLLPARLASPPPVFRPPPSRGECSCTRAKGAIPGGPQWTGRRKGSDGRRGGWGDVKSCIGVCPKQATCVRSASLSPGSATLCKSTAPSYVK